MVIQETKIEEIEINDIINTFKPHYEVVAQNVRGSTSILAILWNPMKIVFEDSVSRPKILSGRFRHTGSRDWALLTRVYGPHIPGEKGVFLQNLENRRRDYRDDLWIVGGDFNMITSLEEKKVGIRHHEVDMEMFRDLITMLHLVDMPSNNGIHTLNNRRGGLHQIAPHLDLFLIFEYVVSRNIFLDASILPCMGSNHWPIQLEIDLKTWPKNRPFIFESFWLRDPKLMKKVEE